MSTSSWHLQPATVARIARVLPAGRAGSHRPNLAGVLLDGQQVAATDAYRVAVADVPDALPRLLLPARELGWAVRAATADGLDLAVYPGGSQLSCPVTGRTWHLAARPSSDYPDPAQLLAQAAVPEGTISVQTAQLRDAVTELSGDAPAQGHALLALEPAAQGLRLSGVDSTAPPATLPARCTVTRPIGVAARFLLDALAGTTRQTVLLEVGHDLRPLRLADDGLVHLIMPCRLPQTPTPRVAA